MDVIQPVTPPTTPTPGDPAAAAPAAPAVPASPATAAPVTPAAAAAPPATPPATEPAVPASAPAAPKSDVFAQLSRKDREIVARDRALKEKEARISQADADEKLLKENPLKFMAAKGISYDQLTKLVLAGGKPEPEDQVKTLAQKIAELDERDRKRDEEKKQAELAGAHQNYLGEVKKFVGSKEADFELLAKQGAYELVDEVTRLHWEATGEVLAIARACELVENHLEDQMKVLLSTGKAKKILSAPAPSDPPKTDAPAPAPAAAPTAPTSLSNSQVARSGEAPPRKFKTDEEELKFLASKYPVWKQAPG